MKLMRHLTRAAVLLTIGLSPAWAETNDARDIEYRIKAAYMQKFLGFVEWPAGAIRGDELVLGVFGENPFGGHLEAIDGTTVNGRTLRVRKLRSLDELDPCAILFISTSERKDYTEIIEQMAGRNVLTVSEDEGFAELGGVLNFYIDEDTVRFEINVDSAQRAGLTVSSRLLRLARVVRQQYADGERGT